VAENAVIGFLSDACCRNGMRAGGMRNDQAFAELVAAFQLMNRRKGTDRRERAQGD